MNQELLKVTARRWLALDQNADTRKRIQTLLDEKNYAVLHALLDEPMTFGTAGIIAPNAAAAGSRFLEGLRAEMDAGFARMNDLTIIQATQGLCMYLLESLPDTCQRKGVVIGFDHRFNSARFAKLAAAVFLAKGVKVYAYDQLVHTPMVPFGVKHYGACAGVMITASHNPKQDNGYKLYWGNACQVISPHDKHIQKWIEASQEPWIWDESLVDTSPLAVKPDEFVIDAYFNELQSLSLNREHNSVENVKIVYTAMHGVGYPFAKRCFSVFNLPAAVPVLKQVEPDPNFPTVKYPNPEEGAGALLLAMETANEHGASVILANDPDADRLAVAEKLADGTWKIFSGNEIGTMLAGHIWSETKKASFHGKAPGDFAMLASTVSSKFIKKMAQVEGFVFEETLTGFKWIGNAALALQQKEKSVLFGFEEAIGFMVGLTVPDKDGISALGVVAELASQLYAKKSSLSMFLESLYERYGYFVSANSYFICHDPAKTKKLFDEIRYCDSKTKLNYPKEIGQFSITAVRDLTAGFDSEQPDKMPLLPLSKSSQMITFQVTYKPEPSVHAVLTLRTSGTEPKIKYYNEISGPWERREKIAEILAELVETIVTLLVRPSQIS